MEEKKIDKLKSKSSISTQKIICIKPSVGENFEEQLISCFNNLHKQLIDNTLQGKQIVKSCFFVKAFNSEELNQFQNSIHQWMPQNFDFFIPISVIAQPPFVNLWITAEFTIIEKDCIQNRIYKSIQSLNYLEIVSDEGSLLIASGLGSKNFQTEIFQQSIEAFEQAKLILENEGLDFSNVVRQWNYIEDIINNSNDNQHYQIFNDIRTRYFNECIFNSGYPAATGIGTETGGVILDFIALKPSKYINQIAIKSPVQTDAHLYSTNVLANNNLHLPEVKTTPKFERAKALHTGHNNLVYVSGTAAIKGEHSVESFSASQQTEMTINNIFYLLSENNLARFQLSGLKPRPISFRVYIKNLNDFSEVERIVTLNIENTPVLFVKADICRPELLVEIEAVFELN